MKTTKKLKGSIIISGPPTSSLIYIYIYSGAAFVVAIHSQVVLEAQSGRFVHKPGKIEEWWAN